MTLKIQKRWLYIIDALILGVALTLVLLSIYGSVDGAKSSDCKTAGTEHSLTLKNDAFSKDTLNLQKCDLIKITNKDTRNFNLAFGVHDRHIRYPGFSERILNPSESLTFSATKAGTYTMHDHLRDQATIRFTIRAD